MSGGEDSTSSSSRTLTLRPNTPTTSEIHKTKCLSATDLSSCSSTEDHAAVANILTLSSQQQQQPGVLGSSTRFYRSRSLHGCGPMTHRQSLSAGGPRKRVGIVIGDFTRIYPDELTLTIGERIEILSKHVDVSRNIGWWTARNSRGDTGLVPVSCVKVIASTSTSSVSDDSTSSESTATSPFTDTMATAMMLMEGMTYPIEIQPEEIQLQEVIGLGGFGRVHKAVYKGQEVAVKVARQTNYDTVKVINEVLTEAEKFAKLAHENVCALVGVSLIKDVYLVMEYAQGGSLSQVIHERGVVIPIDIVLEWSLQISDGMKYLHHEVRPSLIHRDLKSSNILLQNEVHSDNFRNNIVKITDFGLAREIEHTTRMSTAGTYPWMAPEVIKSSEFSTKSDVWSFGVVLWELLTGEKPYTGLNLYLVAYGVGSGSLKLPIHKNCPQQLAILLLECWQKSYMDRPSFKTIFTTLTNLNFNLDIVGIDYEQFKSLQLAWKLEIQKTFQEHKKNEAGFEDKQKDLLSKMRKQDQKVIKLEKEKLQLVNMIEKFHVELKKLSENEQRPPRVKPFSLKRMFEKMMVNKETSKPKGSSKAEAMAKEIQRKMKDIDVTEDLLSRYAQKTSSLGIPSRHTRQPSDSSTVGTNVHVASPILVPQRSASLKRKQTPPTIRTNLPLKPDSSDSSPRRHNSCDSIVPPQLQFDSGKHSITSAEAFSCEVDNLIDFNPLPPSNPLAELDPLKQPLKYPINYVGGGVPTSHDSLFSDSISPIAIRGGLSPTRTSPRQSLTEYRARPRSTHDSTSAPASRPGTPKPQAFPISPSGSVQSLPTHSTNEGGGVSYFGSDSSTSIDLEDTLFTENILSFNVNFDQS